MSDPMTNPSEGPDRKPCKPYRVTLDALLDGVEDHGSRATLEAHARDCAPCRRALGEALAIRSMLSGLVEAQATRLDDEAFVEAVFAKVDSAPTSAAPGPRATAARGSLLKWSLVGSAAAAAAVLALQMGGLTPTPSNSGGPLEQSAAVPPEGANSPLAQGPRIEPSKPEQHPNPRNGDESEDRGPSRPTGSVDSGTNSGTTNPGDESPSAPLTQDQIGRFRSALIETAEKLNFNPEGPGDADAFVAAANRSVMDPRRAARAVLTAALGADPAVDLPSEVALAARFLGPRADLRDRLILKRSIESVGPASAWALIDRGEPGVAALWPMGLSQKSGAPQVAREVLFASASQGRIDLGSLPRGSGDATLAAALIGAGDGDPAELLLDRYIKTGDAPWLDAWAASRGASDSIPRHVEDSRGWRASDRRLHRLLLAVARSRSKAGIPLAIRAIEENLGGGATTLAAIQGQAPVHALFAATAEGQLRDAAEEDAWRVMVRAGAGRVIAVTLSDPYHARDKADLLLGAIVRSVEHRLRGEEQRALVGLAQHLDLYGETRSSALLLLAESCDPKSAPLLPTLTAAVRALRQDTDALVAAAAWLIPAGDQGPSPPHVARVLGGKGSVTVKHARLVRAIEKDRVRVARGSF